MSERPLKIIIVEDEADHAEAICRSFKAVNPEVEILLASTLEEYRSLLAHSLPELVFMDMNLPDGTALDSLTTPAEDGAFPIVIMTSYGNEAIAVNCMKAGAIDYVVKSAEAFETLPVNAFRALREWGLLQDRKRRESILRNQDAELTAIYENAPIIMLLIDRERKLVKMNQQAIAFIGTQAVDLLSQRFGEAMGCIHALDDPAGCGAGPHCQDCLTRQNVMDTFDNGTNHYQEAANLQISIHGKKKVIPVLLSTTLIMLSRPLVLVSIMDISKLKLAEELLREQREQYKKISQENQALLDSIPDAITMVSPAMKVLWGNSATERLLHKGPADIIGQSCYALWHGRTEVCEDCPVVQCFQTGQEIHKIIHSEVSGLTMDVKAVPVLEDRQTVNVIEIARDITENLKMDERIRQSQKLEAIGVLAGGIAHDFNNILAAIIGYADLALEDSASGSGVAKDLDRVLTAAHRAKDLVRQILAFSRQSIIEPIPMKIQPMVKESLKMLRASIPSTISIKESIYPQAGVVLADPTQVHQIVMNLCTNAFHAMEQSGGLLSVGVNSAFIDRQTPGYDGEINPGEYVLLTVSDTGSGIGPDIIGNIFDPYFTTKEVGKGSGLGLSISHGIIKGYGGAITVKSTLGLGTTFQVYFPVIQEEAKVLAEVQAAPRGKGRILFIDDDKLLAEIGQDMLGRLGYSVTVHHHSIEALEAFMDNPSQFDLVITDQTMPIMTGIDLARRMLLIRPGLPIILCTGFSNLVNEEVAKAIGIREFALKPLTKAALGQMVSRILTGKTAC